MIAGVIPYAFVARLNGIRAQGDGQELGLALATAITFGIVAFLSADFTQNSDGVATIWPANGIVLAALILARHAQTRLTLLVLTGLANLIANFFAHRVLIANIGFSLTNILEICIAFSILMARETAPFEFRSVRFFKSFTLAALTASVISAVAAAVVADLTLEAVSWHVLASWLFADLLGLLTVTPALVRLRQETDAPAPAASPIEKYGLFATLAATMVLVVGLPQPLLAFLIIPTLVLIACRLGPNETSAAALLMSAIVLGCTALGFGHNSAITAMAMLTDIQLIQLFILTAFLTVMPLAETIASHARLRKCLSTEIGLRDELNRHLLAQEQTNL
jgi:hypothetical protein